MSNTNTRALPADKREAAREEAAVAHKEELAAREAAVKEEEVEFRDAGYDETLPGQTEVVVGTPEHERLLNSYPNATSYGPDYNVVIPEPEAGEAPGEPVNVDVPHVSQSGTVLNCTMGNWNGVPTSYDYTWFIGGEEVPGDSSGNYIVDAALVGQDAYCVVTASNDFGVVEAPPSNTITIA
jgi:hypothetical protein